MRKQRAVVSGETLVACEVVGNIPVEGQRLAKYFVRDVPGCENDVQVALRDWKGLTVGESVASTSGSLVEG